MSETENKEFEIPTLRDVIEYFYDRKHTLIDAITFYTYQELKEWRNSEGWRIKNWKTTAAFWIKKQKL